MAPPALVFFNPVGRNPVGFDVGCIDHERAEIGIFLRKSFEYPLENTGLGPAFVAVVKGLGRPVFGRNIAQATSTARLPRSRPRTNTFRPFGVRRAILWMFIRSTLMRFCFCKLQLLRDGSNEQRREKSQLGH